MEIRRKKSLILLIAVLTGLVAFQLMTDNFSALQRTVDRFSVDDQSIIERINLIVLKKDTSRILLSRLANGVWMVNKKHEADEVKVNDLLYFLQHASVNRPVSKSAADLINQQISQQGVRVEFYIQTNFFFIPRKKMIKGFFAGMKSPDDESIYMRLIRAETPYEVGGPGSADFDRLFGHDENHWRNPVILDLHPRQIRQVEVNFPDQANESYRLISKPGEPARLFMADGTPLTANNVSQARLSGFVGSFYSLFHERLLNEREVEEIRPVADVTPFVSISVTDTLGNTTLLSCFQLDASHATTLLPVKSPYDPNRFLLQINENEYALAQFLVFQPIMRPLSFFISGSSSVKKDQSSN